MPNDFPFYFGETDHTTCKMLLRRVWDRWNCPLFGIWVQMVRWFIVHDNPAHWGVFYQIIILGMLILIHSILLKLFNRL